MANSRPTTRNLWRATTLLVLLLSHVVSTAIAPPHLYAQELVEVRRATAPSGVPIETLQQPFLPDGADWRHPEAIALLSPTDAIELELAQDVRIAALELQADNNDAYFIEGSSDGRSWTRVWSAPPVEQQGLVVRGVRVPLERQGPFRYLRVRAGAGDGSYSVARLAVYRQVPPDWSADHPSPLTLSPNTIMQLQRYTALLAAILSVLYLIFERCCPEARWSSKLHVALAAFGAFALLLWWGLLRGHDGKFLHEWDFMHYYLGAKYFPELRYDRLYLCTAIADQQSGYEHLLNRQTIRDLRTNELRPSADLLAAPERCTEHFTPERWEQFSADVRWFRGRMSAERWADWKRDHGFNAPPGWLVMGRLFSALGPAQLSTATLLAHLDTALLVGMWLAVWWAFGWQGAAIAAIVWGTNYPARFHWTGGSFLRQDWLALLVLSACFLRRGYPLLAGAALSYSAQLRIFPAVILLAPLLQMAQEMVQRRSVLPSRTYRRFITGFLLALLVIGGLSLVATGTPRTYTEFAANSRKHLLTPLTNNMGLPTVLSYEYATRAEVLRDPLALDPFADWKARRLEVQRDRVPLYTVLIAAYTALLALAVRGRTAWEALLLGCGAIPIFTALTSYYYSFMLLLALLWPTAPWTAPLLLGYSWVSGEIGYQLGWYDQLFTWVSVVALLTVLGVTYGCARDQLKRLQRTGV